MVSEKKMIEDRDIKVVYEGCLSWLHSIDAEIRIERPPTYLSAMHFPGGVHITEYQKEFRISLISVDGGVRLEVNIWRLVDPRLFVYHGGRHHWSERDIHRDKIIEIDRYRKYWGILLQGLYRHISIDHVRTENDDGA